jgi:hypothetical protein
MSWYSFPCCLDPFNQRIDEEDEEQRADGRALDGAHLQRDEGVKQLQLA